MSDPAAQSRSAWKTFGIVLAVIVAVAGLALVAVLVFFLSAMATYGSNK